MVRSLTYMQIKCKTNKLVQFIDQLKIKTVHVTTEVSNYIT